MKFLVVVTLTWAVASPRPKGRIIGGEDTPIEKVPYQISLQFDGTHQCGGSIIAPNFVVTAAHCTLTASENNQKLSIRAGTSTRENGGQVIDVKNVYNHPKYSTQTWNNDIAIVELEENLVFGDKVATINLPKPNQSWPSGTEVLITGWGQTGLYNFPLPINLQGVTVQILDSETCKSIYGSIIDDTILCAGFNGRGACHSDSGGPLVADGVLIGVENFGSCGQHNDPEGYANVANLLDFIQDVTGLEVDS